MTSVATEVKTQTLNQTTITTASIPQQAEPLTTREVVTTIERFQRALDKIAKYDAITKARNQKAQGPGVDLTTASCLITLSKVLDNILLERKYNPKTRSIKLGNKLFRERVGRIPGGVDFLLACDFEYARVPSKTPIKKTSKGTIPGNAVNLPPANECRERLVIGRKYLQEFCQAVFLMKVGKHRNEIPSYVVTDSLSAECLSELKNNISKVIENNSHVRSVHQIENIESISRQRSMDYDNMSSGCSLMTPVSQPLDMSESAPPSPSSRTLASTQDDDSSLSPEVTAKRKQKSLDEIPPLDVNLNVNVTKLDQHEGSERSKRVNQIAKIHEEKKDDIPEQVNEEKDIISVTDSTPLKSNQPRIDIPNDISPVAMEKSYQETEVSVSCTPFVKEGSTEEMQRISPHAASDDVSKKSSNTISDELSQSIENRLNTLNVQRKSDDIDLADLNGDDTSICSTSDDLKSPIVPLTDEQLDALENITKCDVIGETDDDCILMVTSGIKSSRKPVKKGSLFDKLNKLRSKKDPKERGKCEPVEAASVASSFSSNSQIKIKDTEALSVSAEVLKRIKAGHSKQKSKPTKTKFDGIQIKDDVYAVDIGLKTFFSVVVATYNRNDIVPVEIVFKLWSALLRSERSFNDLNGREILKATFQNAKSQIQNISSELFPSLGDEDSICCQFVLQSLQKIGVFAISTIPLEMHVGGKNAQNRVGLRVDNESSILYGQHLAKNVIKLKYESCIGSANPLERFSARCHSILADSLLQNIDLDSKDEIFVDQTLAFDRLTTWYILKWLPYHMMHAGLTEKALDLLIDRRYMDARLQSNGLNTGTLQYIDECKTILSKATEESPDTSTVVTEDDYALRAVKAVMEKLHTYLDDRRKSFSLTVLRSQKKIFCDLGDALHSLAGALGSINGMRHTEVDVLNEAIRFKIAGEAEKMSIADTHLQLAAAYNNIQDPMKAISSYGEALNLHREVFGENHAGVSKILYQLGVLYCSQDQTGPALDCFQRALSVYQSQPNKQSLKEEISKIYSWIGNVHRTSGNSKVALQYFEKAREAMESIVGRDHLSMAEVFQNIGILYDDIGEDEKSLVALKECLRIRRLLLQPSFHRDICETIACIANIYKKSNLDKSLRLFRIILNERAKAFANETGDEGLLQCYDDMLEVAKIKLKHEGDNELHLEIATLYFRKGSLLETMNRFTEAIDCFIRSLKIRKIKKQYHEIGDLLNSLGIAHAKRRSFQKAMRCFSDCLKVRQTILGQHHEDCGETLHNMGNCAAKQNDLDKAAECYEKSLIIKRLAFGNKSISTANTLQNIGMINEKLGLLDDSLNYYKDALAIRLSLLGKKHIEVAFSLHSIGAIYHQKEEHEKATECLQTSLKLKYRHYVGSHLSIAETLNLLASSLTVTGKNNEAKTHFQEALVIYEKKFGAHMTTCSVLDSLGSVCLSLLCFDEAYRYLERALALKRLIFGEEDIEVCNTLFFIGKVQSKSGDMDDALNTFKEVLRMRKKLFGEDSTEVAAIINDVGVIQLRRSQVDIAQNCFLESQRIWTLRGDEGKEHFGETLVNLGEIDHLQERYSEAIQHFGEALKIFEAAHDKAHLSVALVLHKLGRAYKEKGDYDDANVTLEKALSMRTEILGDGHVLVAEVLKDIGDLCLILGDLLKAREYLGESLKTMKSHSPTSIKTADAYLSMGKVMVKMKYKDEAFDAFSTALRIKRKRLEEDDISVAYILSEMGLIHEDRKQWQSSLDMYGQALKIRETKSSQDESVADSYFAIGAVQQTIRKHDKALASYGSALVLYQKVLGDDHLTCAKTMNNIGIVYECIEQYDEALKYHQESLRIRRLHLGHEHIKVANSLDNIAGIYQKQHEGEKALKCLKESLKIRSRFGNDNLDVATTLFGMGIIYCDTGDMSKALECYEAALNIRKARGKEFEVAQTLHNIGSLFALQQDYRRALKHWINALQIYRRTLDDDHHMIACTLGNIKMAESMLNEERMNGEKR